jgi:hypothetical protein
MSRLFLSEQNPDLQRFAKEVITCILQVMHKHHLPYKQTIFDKKTYEDFHLHFRQRWETQS